jgi:hypothetical protein
MIKNVVVDLKRFITIYFILSLGFSLTFCVLGIGNLKVPGAFRDQYLDMSMGISDEEEEEDENYKDKRALNAFYRVLKGGKGGGGEYPGAAYKFIGMFVGTFLTTIRTSMADFEIIKLSPYLQFE